MSTRTIHMRLDVRGALQWDKRQKKRMAPAFTVDGRTLKTADEVTDFLMDCLQEGRAFLPMGECEGFWERQQCPGHPPREPHGGAR